MCYILIVKLDLTFCWVFQILKISELDIYDGNKIEKKKLANEYLVYINSTVPENIINISCYMKFSEKKVQAKPSHSSPQMKRTENNCLNISGKYFLKSQ